MAAAATDLLLEAGSFIMGFSIGEAGTLFIDSP
jgi:hypothetical protein